MNVTVRHAMAPLGVLLLLDGCAAATTAIGKRELAVETRMTKTIFLDPVPADRQTVFVQIKNTSDRPDLTSPRR